jgi:hypothetical protein
MDISHFERDLKEEIACRKRVDATYDLTQVERRQIRYTLVGLQLAYDMFVLHKNGGELPADA